MRIALFDSGLGGLTVLSEAVKQLPNEDFLFFADTLHVPYGTKTKEQVQRFVRESLDQMLTENIKALVIACNTATSAAAEELRKEYSFPIIGMEPAVKPAVEMNRDTGRRVLVAATPLTLHQSKYAQLVSRVDDHSIVDSLPLPELVSYCEAMQFDEDVLTAYFNEKFAAYPLDDYGTLVLGCTHFPFFKPLLSRILPKHIEIIDGSRGTIRRLRHVLDSKGLLDGQGRGDIRFACSSQDPVYLRKMQQAYDLFHSRESHEDLAVHPANELNVNG
ncbi:glutamate racemase [Paenibacillus chibensis]|uniref:Glutamate racemase n=1 Tax=Paenibacillus chibensis TaxID=59846 RepID=A0ABU6PX24_9BACL|nr:glutamate racemase [Paenibacillus chibensis]